MNERRWSYEREGASVGPFTRGELEKLLAAGLVAPDTHAIDDRGLRTTVAAALTDVPAPASPAPIPPPPPLPTWVPPPLPGRVFGSAAAPWHPLLIAGLGLVLTPLWAGIMASLNASRLGLPTAWRPAALGVGSLLLYLALNVCLVEWAFLNALIYLGALGLIAWLDLLPQLASYGERSGAVPGPARWGVPVACGVPAGLAALAALVVLPLLPDSPRAVCEAFMAATTADGARGLVTANLQPFLAAQPADGRAFGHGCRLTSDEGTPPNGAEGHLVGFRIDAAGDTPPIDGAFHLLWRDGRWKIEEAYFTGSNGEAFEAWRPMSQTYGGLADNPAEPAAPASGSGGLGRTFEEIRNKPGLLLALKALVASGGAKKVGALALAACAAVAALAARRQVPDVSAPVASAEPAPEAEPGPRPADAAV